MWRETSLKPRKSWKEAIGVMMKVYQAARGDFDGLQDMLDREQTELRGVMEDVYLHGDVASLLQSSVLGTETQQTDVTGSGDVDSEFTDGCLEDELWRKLSW